MMLPILCMASGCGHRFQRTASEVLEVRPCPRCGSLDLDLDDGRTASTQEPNELGGSSTCPHCSTANYNPDTSTCSNCGYAPEDTAKEGAVRRASFEPPAAPGAPALTTARPTEVVDETARCSSCFNEFAYKAADPTEPVPPCPACGSMATSPAGAGALASRVRSKMDRRTAKRAEIARSVLASNPGMDRARAFEIASETIRRFPKVVR